MIKFIPLLVTILITIIQVKANTGLVRPSIESFQPQWFSHTSNQRNDILKKWYESKRMDKSPEDRAVSSLFQNLRSNHQFKGCIDPSEPFQCPQSERCIALQFICDGHPGDCPGNIDENEETCIAAKRPAKENIEKFLHAEYTLHGPQLFVFLFGEKLTNSIEENNTFWFDALASAFSVAKNLGSFADKMRMSSDDLAHFRNVIEVIHNGRLEEIPIFAQEAVNHGLASLVEKLYESGFMKQ